MKTLRSRIGARFVVREEHVLEHLRGDLRGEQRLPAGDAVDRIDEVRFATNATVLAEYAMAWLSRFDATRARWTRSVQVIAGMSRLGVPARR